MEWDGSETQDMQCWTASIPIKIWPELAYQEITRIHYLPGN